MTFAELRQQVLQLPQKDRQTLAYELLNDLANDSRFDWLAIVTKRQDEAKSGKVELIDRDQFMSEMRKEFDW